MTRLFDVNVLIAIVDPVHTFHGVVHGWLKKHRSARWASCPITENGFVRILSQPGYQGTRRTPSEAILLLRTMKESALWSHTFWADDISISEATATTSERLVSPGQITDVYLVALALSKGGRLVTFDRSVPWQCVPGGSETLIEIPS